MVGVTALMTGAASADMLAGHERRHATEVPLQVFPAGDVACLALACFSH